MVQSLVLVGWSATRPAPSWYLLVPMKGAGLSVSPHTSFTLQDMLPYTPNVCSRPCTLDTKRPLVSMNVRNRGEGCSEGGLSALQSCPRTRQREGLNLGGQQMPSPRPWKMIRRFHSTGWVIRVDLSPRHLWRDKWTALRGPLSALSRDTRLLSLSRNLMSLFQELITYCLSHATIRW